MKLNSCEKTGTNEYTIDLTIEADVFSAQVDKVAKRELKKIQLPGFRKGKAPRAMVEKMYGKDVFYEDALEALYTDAYLAAVKEAGIKTVGDPFGFDVVSMSLEDGAQVTCKVYVKPEVTIENYKGVEAPKAEVEVTDEEVESELERMRENNARFIDVDSRAAQDGDIVTIDYLGKLDGEPFEGGTAKDSELTLGSGMFIDGFESQIVGHEIGDKFVIDVTFPEDYGASDLAGKAVTFDINLKAIKVKELDELDDEFAKDVSEFDTIDELKADIKKNALEKKQEDAETAFKNAALDKVADLLEVEEIPEPMIDAAINDMLADLDYNLRMNGTSLENYMKITGMTEAQFKNIYRDRAEKNVRLSLALEKIAEIEGFEATEEAIEEEYKKIADSYGISVDDAKKYLSDETVTGDIIKRQSVDLIAANAVAVAPEEPKEDDAADEAEAEEAPAEE